MIKGNFFHTSQAIGWEERLQNDLFCVEWELNFNLASEIKANNSIIISAYFLEHMFVSRVVC